MTLIPPCFCERLGGQAVRHQTLEVAAGLAWAALLAAGGRLDRAGIGPLAGPTV